MCLRSKQFYFVRNLNMYFVEFFFSTEYMYILNDDDVDPIDKMKVPVPINWKQIIYLHRKMFNSELYFKFLFKNYYLNKAWRRYMSIYHLEVHFLYLIQRFIAIFASAKCLLNLPLLLRLISQILYREILFVCFYRPSK